MTLPVQIPAKKSKLGGGVAGGACGALIIHFAKSLPDGFLYKDVLLYVAPTISIAAGVIATLILLEIKFYYKNYKLKRIKIKLKENINDPDISDDYKQTAQKDYDQVIGFQNNQLLEEAKDIFQDKHIKG